ncbi:hypothetical protein GmHk_08G024263 [Glycine max]|nr:hypothetical protein GmHk_08G024263 [Glycine max]
MAFLDFIQLYCNFKYMYNNKSVNTLQSNLCANGQWITKLCMPIQKYHVESRTNVEFHIISTNVSDAGRYY